MFGELDDVRDGKGMMKSSTKPESSDVGCMMTETCSKTVSGNVFDTLNYGWDGQSRISSSQARSEYLEHDVF